MTHIVTLLSNPQEKCVTPALVQNTRKALGACVEGEPRWLAAGIACEIPITLTTPHPRAVELPTDLPDKVDVAVQAAGQRRKRLLAADMDSTIITHESLDVLAQHLGLGNAIARITEQAMRGEIEFSQALNARMELFAGVSVARLGDISLPLTPGAQTLIATMRAQGAYCLLLSGGLTPFVEKVAHQAGFNRFCASVPEVIGGCLTGKITTPLTDKGEYLRQEAQRQKIDLQDTLAVGDGANDITMLQAAGLAVGFHPKAALKPYTHVRLAHADLTALLYLQGYTQKEFVNSIPSAAEPKTAPAPPAQS